MGILSILAGGSKSKNKAFPALNSALMPAVTGGVNALNDLSSELSGGFDAYKKNAGFDFALNQLMRGTTGGAAAGGMLRSGATGNAIADRLGNVVNTFYDNYLNKKAIPAQLGLGAAGTLAGAGQVSKSQGGLLPAIGGLFSDRRLKENIRPVGKLDNGLTVYAYNYIDGGATHIGLMADEVEAVHPEAVASAQTFFSEGTYSVVDYDKAVI